MGENWLYKTAQNGKETRKFVELFQEHQKAI